MIEIIIGLISFVLFVYPTTIFKLKPIIENYVKKEESKFFNEVESTTSVDKKLFEKWVNTYYRINAPKENLEEFHKWARFLLPLLFISLLVDIFWAKIPSEFFGAIILLGLTTGMAIILFFMFFLYLINWYMKEYNE